LRSLEKGLAGSTGRAGQESARCGQDGADNASKHTLSQTLKLAEQSNAI
jgi:hypothetical protein